MAQKKESHGVAVGLAAAAVAATAGAIFLYGTKQGKQQRKKISGWMLKAKGEVLERVEKLKEVNEEAYHKVVDAVASKYAGVKNVDPAEITKIFSEIKGHWNNIKKQLKGAPKKKAASKKK